MPLNGLLGCLPYVISGGRALLRCWISFQTFEFSFNLKKWDALLCSQPLNFLKKWDGYICFQILRDTIAYMLNSLTLYFFAIAALILYLLFAHSALIFSTDSSVNFAKQHFEPLHGLPLFLSTRSRILSNTVPGIKCFGLQQILLSHVWRTNRSSGSGPFPIKYAILWARYLCSLISNSPYPPRLVLLVHVQHSSGSPIFTLIQNLSRVFVSISTAF